MTEASLLNDAEAVFPRASTDVTEWAPVVEAGTVNVALNDPAEEDVTVVGVVDCVTPSYFTVIMDEPAKPVPETVTVEPTMPLVGFRLIEALIVKIAEPVCADTSVAATVCAPFVEAGTVKVALNEPTVEEATVVGRVV